jgi:hypothetical protein
MTPWDSARLPRQGGGYLVSCAPASKLGLATLKMFDSLAVIHYVAKSHFITPVIHRLSKT